MTDEKDIEQKLTRMVRQHGGDCLKWVCPGWAGVPDRICLLPGGRVFFIELKRTKGGKISSRQLWWADRLTGLGFEHRFIFDDLSIKSFERRITEWDGGLK